MRNLNLGYQDLQSMPWEYQEWFYNRHLQFLIDQEQAMNQQRGIYK